MEERGALREMFLMENMQALGIWRAEGGELVHCKCGPWEVS